MILNRKPPLLFVILLVLSSLFACQAKQPVDKVRLQLKWIDQAQFAGYYVALEKGFYREEHIDLEIVPGGPGLDYFDALESGQVDIAVVRPEGIFIERQEGNPVKAFATIFQINPYLMVSLKESGITSPGDFPGKTVALQGTNADAQFEAMLLNLGVDPDSITYVPFTFDYQPFYNGEVDVMPAFAAGSLLDIQREGVELNYIWPSDYGVHWYSDSLAASEDFLESNPDLVTRFLWATLRGHQYLFSRVEESVDITMKYATVQDRDVQTAMLEASLPLMVTGEYKLGEMDPAVWQGMEGDLLEFGYLSDQLPLSQVLTPRFVEDIYSE